jgi:outer membrane protein TolC
LIKYYSPPAILLIILSLTINWYGFTWAESVPVDGEIPTADSNNNRTDKDNSLRHISLAECLRIARENSGDLQAAEARLKIANLKNRDAKKTYWPKVSAGVRWVVDDERGIDIESGDRWEGFVDISQSPLNSGEVSEKLKNTAVDFSVANLNSEQTKRILALTVAEKYFALISAQRQLTLEQALVEKSRRDFQAASAKYRDGVIAEIELIQAEAELINIELNLHTQKRALEHAIMALAIAMGLPSETRLQAIDVDLLEPYQIDWNQAKELAIENNIELKIHQEALKQLKKFHKLAKRARWPQMSLGAYIGPNPPHPFDEDAEVGLTFTVSQKLFDAGITSRRIERSRIEIKSQKTLIKNFEQKFIGDLRLLYDGLNISKEDYQNAGKRRDLAKRLAHLSQRSYELGVSSLKDKLDAANTAKKAEIAYANALTKYLLAEFKFKIKMGIDPVESAIKQMKKSATEEQPDNSATAE